MRGTCQIGFLTIQRTCVYNFLSMYSFPFLAVAILLLPIAACSDKAKTGPDSHLLITEIVMEPTTSEFIEIYNPTGDIISLDNYYLSDKHTRYYYLVRQKTEPDFISEKALDFVIRFPPGHSLAPGSFAVIVDEAGEFLQAYPKAAAHLSGGGFQLFEAVDTDASVPDMISQASRMVFSISFIEPLILFYWDGVSDLVQDVDIVVWGNDEDFLVDKSGRSFDSDFDNDEKATEYAHDHASMIPRDDGQGGNNFLQDLAIKRIIRPRGSEIGEISKGGNGIHGHHETSEDLSLSFLARVLPTPGQP